MGLSCPSENEIAELVAGALRAERRARVTEHLDACAACRALVAELIAERSSVVADAAPNASDDAAPLPLPQRGESIGRYVLLAWLGQGGMGTVFRARDTVLHREVALKIIDPRARPGAVARILREARAGAAIQHPNVVATFDVGEARGYAYIAIELVEGRTLRSAMKDASLETRTAWLADIASALAAAHALSIVHRDIKPDNVMIRDDGIVKVLDFGLARWLDDRADALTAKGALTGTPAYMAPEQLRGEVADAKTDQFAWGVLAYEVLTGERPWVLPTRDAVVRATFDGVPAPVRDVVARAMRHEASDRFAGMADVVEALGAAAPAHSRRAPTRRSSSLRAVAAVWWCAACALVALAYVATPATPKGARPLAPAPLVTTTHSSLSFKTALAVDAYEAGKRAQHDGAIRRARASFAHATELDPSFAEAHLRYLLTLRPGQQDATGLEHLREVTRLRAFLGERDRALLNALSLEFRFPIDLPGAAASLDSALERIPVDVESLVLLARLHYYAGNYRAALRASEDALGLDSQCADALRLKAAILVALDEVDEARRTYSRCIDASPAATTCLDDLVNLDANEGRCQGALENTRHIMAMEPSFDMGPTYLANALVALGQPVETAELALSIGRARLPAEEGALAELNDRANAEIFAGRFEDAAKTLALVETKIRSSTREVQHLDLMRVRARLALELEHPDEAIRIADTYLRERSGWTPVANVDASIYALVIKYRAHALGRDAFVAMRREWLAHERMAARPPIGRTNNPDGLRWTVAFADAVDDEEDGRAAVAELPGFLPLPDAYTRSPDYDEPIGRAFLFAGDLPRARVFLERGCHACTELFFALYELEAKAEYVRVYARIGDEASACAAYRRLEEHLRVPHQELRVERLARRSLEGFDCARRL